MLDTNLWSYLGDEGTVRAFDAEVARRSLRVMMAPSMLVEVLGHPKTEVRQRILKAIGTGPRHRLPTEASVEAAEVVSEAQRLRPRWLRQIPDVGGVASLHTLWTKTLWRDALADSQSQHEFVTASRRLRKRYVIN